MRRIAACVLLVLAVVAGSCSNDSTRPDHAVPIPDPPPYGYPPSWMDTIIVDTTLISRGRLDDDEAEWVALYLSRDLVAPMDLYDRVVHDLQTIRTEYQYLDPPLVGWFSTVWVPGDLEVRLTEQATAEYQAGTYTDLDSLNQFFDIDWIQDKFIGLGGAIWLYFKGSLNPARLAEFYSQVPSVAETSIRYQFGDGDRVYPWYANGKLTYLFRDGDGDDCIFHCEDKRFWYFRTSDDGSVEYVGTYAPSTDDVPDWWDEAKRNADVFWGEEWY